MFCVRSKDCTGDHDQHHRKSSGLQVRYVWSTALKGSEGNAHYSHTCTHDVYAHTVPQKNHTHTDPHTTTCSLRHHGPPNSLHSHPRVPVAVLVLQTALAEPLSQLVITTLPPRFPLVLSCCALTICSNWLGPKHHITHTTGDPKILRTHKQSQNPEDTQAQPHMCGSYSCDNRKMLWQSRKAIYCASGRKQTRAKWQNIPGRKYADVKHLRYRHWSG